MNASNDGLTVGQRYNLTPVLGKNAAMRLMLASSEAKAQDTRPGAKSMLLSAVREHKAIPDEISRTPQSGAVRRVEWPWSCSSNGYSAIAVDGVMTTAHRMAWKLSAKSIPDGLVVMHSCDNRKCINLKHLKLGRRSRGNLRRLS